MNPEAKNEKKNQWNNKKWFHDQSTFFPFIVNIVILLAGRV